MSDRPVAVVLAGGGARGAYELGALSVLIPLLEARGERPTLYVGTSVGAINAVGLAASRERPAREAIADGLERWRAVDMGAVLRPVLQRLPLTALRIAGGALGVPGMRLESLLDPAPLEENLRHWIDWRQLHVNVSEGLVDGVAVVATQASSGRSVAFVEGRLDGAAANAPLIDYIAASVEPEHVRASAAIPLLFPPVRVERPASARGWYVDGGTRLNTPVRPAIDLGAERIVVVSTGSVAPPRRRASAATGDPPDLAARGAQLLQGALADPLVEDMRRLGDINAFYAESNSPAARRHRRAMGRPPYRLIPYIFVAPRRAGAIAELALRSFRARYGGVKRLRSPDLAALDHLLGGDASTHGELLSYLLFDSEYISRLIEMGRRDARAWLRASESMGSPWQLEHLEVLARQVPTGRRRAARGLKAHA